MARMTRCAQKTLKAADGEEPVCSEASTDCNIPLSRHIPAICVGFCRGGGADYRGQGISEVMYAEAEKDIAAKFPGSRITLRTWSTNGAQEHILDKLGYSLVRRLKDDRGEGIDTVYFVKKEENDR